VTAALVSRRLKRQASGQINLIGFMTLGSGTQDPRGPAEAPEGLTLPHLGDASELARAARDNGIARIVIADDAISAKETSGIISSCREAEIPLTLVPARYEVLGPNTELNRIAEIPMLDFHSSAPPRSTLIIKRSIDILVSSVMLLLASPVLAVSSILVKLDSPGPVFFRQIRVGKDGRKFTMYKLRTMVCDAEDRLDDLIDLSSLEEPVFKIENDPRVTRVGSILRRTSIDEIPQFVNVLRGEMSLVGPRPEEEAVVALYDQRQRERLAVKPGLTGPMQVAGRGDLNFEERLAMERDYLDNLTITGDVLILLRTPRAVIKGDGAT
jgi:exopolysaccharide biosynthesis polyprenyl glycosylphosphotransferase